MSKETPKEFNLESFLGRFSGLAQIDAVPGDGNEPKYWVVAPLASKEPKFVVECESSTQNQTIFNPDEVITINGMVITQPTHVRDLDDIPSGCFLSGEDIIF